MPTSARPYSELPPMERLRAIMHRLRAPGGCPWDAEQTHESLLPHLIEEAYEVAEAVRSGDRDALVDELGDLLLQPVFHAEIASETGAFDFDDIAMAIADKLVRRHPHVFGDAEVADADGVLRQWDAIKRDEKGEADAASYYLEKASDGLPALMSAAKIQKKVARIGFDWPGPEPIFEKIREETAETEQALRSGDRAHLEEEIGDLLFAVVNLARKEKLDPELLLARANAKFVNRFQQVEDRLRDDGLSLAEATLEQMDAAWEAVKTTGA
ncbi:MAG: nucleoside triphosphate pyrophosphohydrolase [Verrucomicrobiae bacterium]|nr:nucleoside triphosphate pyrophosphohydrolase [Verrucomicrobiae bacterium]